jgi:predicted TPR repeat methyltransferase
MTNRKTEALARADAHYDAHRWDEAGKGYESELALDPRQPEAWYRLGNVREELGCDAEALACFEKAVALNPGHAQAWNNLGGAHERLGHPQQAIAAFRSAVHADPSLPQPYLNLGRPAEARGDRAMAAQWFRAGLAQNPGDATFQHLVNAATGVNTACAPRDYVTALFNGFAPLFEQRLVQELEYRVPEALARLVQPALQAVPVPARVIDLGSGTGLVGVALAGLRAQITGVDLSPRMLEVAAGHGVYARLEHGDFVEFLGRCAAGSAHAVLAADVFIYVGDLQATFAAVARVLAPGGVFGFSVEHLAEGEGDYRLHGSGRYAQSPRYLRRLAAVSGLLERRLEDTRIRREGEGYAEGWLAVFSRPVSAP